MNLREGFQWLIRWLVRKCDDRVRRRKHARDLERINAASERLALEAADVLEYQAHE
jgi:hypothetical protein